MPSLTSAAAWPVGPPLALVAAAALLYWLGGRRQVSRSRSRRERRLREAAFATGLLAVLAALDSPLEPLSEKLFAAHMAQHLLLLTVAPPLIVLGAPWLRLWQPLPLGLRRRLARQVARGRWSRPLRLAAHLLSRPLPVLVLYCATLLVWHLPPLYDATLSSAGVHYGEHALFFSTALLFWSQVIDSRPVRAQLALVRRCLYVGVPMVVGWLLALVLAFARTPLYSYADLAHRPGGLSALADQQIAAGVMWVPGSVAYLIAIVVLFYRWLEPEPANAFSGRRNGSPLGVARG